MKTNRDLARLLVRKESAALADVLTAILEDEQSWYWSEEWQAGERAAEADLAAGRGQVFDTMEDFLQDLGLDLDKVRRA
jgi:hypothetical protein